MRILGVCGSLQARSSNLTLLKDAERWLPSGAQLRIFEGIADLPHFNPDLEGASPPSVTAWREAVASHDALLVATPEYGHSLPGSLKNAVDWLIGTGELNRKVVGVAASTLSADRGLLGLAALVTTLGAVDAIVVGGRPIVRDGGYEAGVRALLAALAEAAASDVTPALPS